MSSATINAATIFLILLRRSGRMPFASSSSMKRFRPLCRTERIFIVKYMYGVAVRIARKYDWENGSGYMYARQLRSPVLHSRFKFRLDPDGLRRAWRRKIV